jgi:hypothetical protein
MKTSEKILTALVIIFALSTVYSLTQCYFSRQQLQEANQSIKGQKANEKIVIFTQLFVDKVLSGQDEVSFEDRLQLENAVRDINNQEIFTQWQKFAKGGTTTETQQNLAKLLKLLMSNISY